MGAYLTLFSIEVVHAYFSDPAACRLAFTPDAVTADWLTASGCVLRRGPNGLKVYYEAANPSAGERASKVQTVEPSRLSFTVNALDPMFGLYTDGLAPDDPLSPGVPQLVFDSARAKLADPSTNRWSLTARTAAGMGGLNGRPKFVVTIGLAGDLSDAGRTYQIDFKSRATVWKYLLIGDWAADRPCVIDADQPAGDLFKDPFADLSQPPIQERLADGRMAIPVRSTAPIVLADRPTRKIQLWSRSEAGARERMLVSSLPYAAAGNFAIETAGDPSTLVTEVFVSR